VDLGFLVSHIRGSRHIMGL